MSRHNGEIRQLFAVAGVDEAMRMSLGTVMAIACHKVLLAVVIEATCHAGGDENHLAVGLVLVVADGAARIEATLYDFVHTIEKSARFGVPLTSFEARRYSFLYFVKVYDHNFEVLIIFYFLEK